MKNKIQKFAAVIILTILVSTNSFAGDTYASRGAWIGATTAGVLGAGLGGLVGYSIAASDTSEYGTQPSSGGEKATGLIIGAVTFGGIGAVAGAGIGALIGLAIPKHPKVSVAPLFIQSKTQGNTTGASVAFHF